MSLLSSWNLRPIVELLLQFVYCAGGGVDHFEGPQNMRANLLRCLELSTKGGCKIDRVNYVNIKMSIFSPQLFGDLLVVFPVFNGELHGQFAKLAAFFTAGTNSGSQNGNGRKIELPDLLQYLQCLFSNACVKNKQKFPWRQG